MRPTLCACAAAGLAFTLSCKNAPDRSPPAQVLPSSANPPTVPARPTRAHPPRLATPALLAQPDGGHQLPRADPAHRQVRERARAVLELHCGLCHRADLPTANPGALAVFDLTQTRWQRRMRPDQLRDALRRLRKRRTMSDLERSYLAPRGFPPPPRPTPADIRRLRHFVELELRQQREGATGKAKQP